MSIDTTRGPSGELLVGRGADFQRDLQVLAKEVVARGNVFKGTRTVRNQMAANPERYGMKPGDLFIEVYYEDYSVDYDRLGDSLVGLFIWVGNPRGYFAPFDGGVNKVWGSFRGGSRATDDLAAGKFTSVAKLTAYGALPGSYMVHVSGKWFTANSNETTIGYRRVLINGKNPPATIQSNPGSGIGDMPCNLGYTDNDLSLTTPFQFKPDIAAGNDVATSTITVELLLNPATVTGRVWNVGTGISLQYVGRDYS